MGNAYHAKLGPSSAHRWRKCTASIGASVGKPNDGSDASRLGTACHGVVAECLQSGNDANEFLGREFLFYVDVFGERAEDFAELLTLGDMMNPVLQYTVPITPEMVGWCQSYLDFVREQHTLLGGELLVEQQVPIGHITGEEGGRGTSDAIILAGKTLVVIDAKFGRNRVVAYEVVRPSLPDPITSEMQPPIYAPNDQLAMYAGGALEAHGMLHDFETVKMIIVQPPINHVSEFTIPAAGLLAHLDEVKIDAEATRSNPTYVAGDHCTYCPSRISCTARDAEVLTTAMQGFTDVSDPAQIAQAIPRQFDGNMLGVLFTRTAMIKQWCDDIAARVFNTLNTGGKVIAPDGTEYKLVAGKKGSRQWSDIEEAEATLKRMRLKKDEMYDFSLISPTTADKLAHPKAAKKGQPEPIPLLGDRQWTTLLRLITQADPKPVIAPGSDPRPAILPAVDGFADTSSQPTSTAEVDLF